MEVTVGGSKYSTSRFASVFDAFDVCRDLGPVLAGLAQLRRDNKEVTPERFTRAFCALAAGIDRESAHRAMGKCLDAVRRDQSGQAWVPVKAPGVMRMMFDDIGLEEMLHLVWHVLEENQLLDFFAGLPATSGEPGAP